MGSKIKKGYYVHLELETEKNNYFRRVLYTAKHSQLVLMNVKVGEEIGEEIHAVDQFIRFEEGEGIVIINENKYNVKDGDAVVIPAGSKHNVINTSKNSSLKLYTVYSPPEHNDKLVHKTKIDSMKPEEEFDGVTTE